MFIVLDMNEGVYVDTTKVMKSTLNLKFFNIDMLTLTVILLTSANA